MPTANRFILSDQTLNSFGFVVLTAGIGLESFVKNPVMLYNHQTCNAVGMWSDVKVEGDQLTALPQFDEGDEEAKKLMGKVERGFLKGCSIGFAIQDLRIDHPGMEGVPVVTKCELYEASITPLPSNANALRIYNEEGKLMTDEQVRDFIQLSKENSTNPTVNMKNLALIIATLQLTPGSTEDQVVEAINKNAQAFATLKTEHETLKSENATLKTQVDTSKKERVDALIDGAIAANKLTAAERPTWHTLATADFDTTKKALDSRPGHTPISGNLNRDNNPADTAFDGKTFFELKKSPEGVAYLERLSTSNADLFNKKKITPNAVVAA